MLSLSNSRSFKAKTLMAEYPNLYVGFTGVITFKSAGEFQIKETIGTQVAQTYTLLNLLCPYHFLNSSPFLTFLSKFFVLVACLSLCHFVTTLLSNLSLHLLVICCFYVYFSCIYFWQLLYPFLLSWDAGSGEGSAHGSHSFGNRRSIVRVLCRVRIS